MAETRGRPLAYLGLAIVGWSAMRFAVQPITAPPVPVREGLLQPVAIPDSAGNSTKPEPRLPALAKALSQPRLPDRRRPTLYDHIKFGLHPAMDPWQEGGRPSGLPDASLVAEVGRPGSPGRDTPPTNAPALVGKAGTPELVRGWGKSLYAYSFWRLDTGSAGSSLAPQGQYGGSQSGLVLTLSPFGANITGPSLLARASATPGGTEKELALGLRWRPSAKWPVSLSAERRFRLGGPDRFAAYVAGGIDAQPVLGKLTVDAYGQGGFASGRGGGLFFDAQARAMHPLVQVAGVPVSAGAGSWAGGQRGASRLDVGPALAAPVDAGIAKFRLQLDWRQRVAGNAEPKQGLALTLSTGF